MAERLDALLVRLGLTPTRSKSQDLIKKGKVQVNGKVVTKASLKFEDTDNFEVDTTELFVGRGAEKMKGAHQDFQMSFSDKVVGDMGASTGGFVEYALLNGAKKVYAIDVGHNQLDPKLVSDSRVINMEGTNIKDGLALPESCDLIVIDLSFISLSYVIDPILSVLREGGELVALIKPQFEVGKESLGKNGIVKDHSAVLAALENIYELFDERGLRVVKAAPCTIQGKTGNQEYFFYGLYDKTKSSMQRETLLTLIQG